MIIGVEPLGHLAGGHGGTAVGVGIGSNRRGEGRVQYRVSRGSHGAARRDTSALYGSSVPRCRGAQHSCFGQRGGHRRLYIRGASDLRRLLGIAKTALHRTPPGHPEIVVQHITPEALHPLGQIAQQEAHVQHLVVERKVPHRNEVQPVLFLPVTGTQFPAGGPQRLAAALALPVRLQSELQFAFGANARKTEIVGSNHDESCM